MSDYKPAIRCVLLKDNRTLVQCILPFSSLLDLRTLQSVTDRGFVPLSQEDIVSASRNRHLQPLEGCRDVFTLPTLIDSSLSAEDALVVNESGMTLSALRATLHEREINIRHIAFTLNASELKHDLPEAGSDTQQISDSIQNFTSLRIRQRLDETLEIPPLSATADRIMALRANPNATVSELTSIVEADPSLAAQVVSWASSPYYAAPGKIRSVQDAIIRVLGFDLVSNLAIGLILGKTVEVPKDQSAGFTPYWLQAVYCSTAVEAMARMVPGNKRPRQGMIYLSGLLHNFGFLVLAHTFPEHFSTICRYTEANPEISHVAIEKHLIGISREQISAWLMQSWTMPEEVSVALRYQQDGTYNGPHAIYANLIFIAMRLFRAHGIGDAPPEPVSDAMFERCGLDRVRCEELIAKLVLSADIALIADQMSI